LTPPEVPSIFAAMRGRLWLLVPLALGCQSRSASLSLTVPPGVDWLLAVYRSGDGSAVAASALGSADEVVKLEVDDLPAPRLSVLGFRRAQLEGLVSDAAACGTFRPAEAGEPILPEAAWVSSFQRSDGRFVALVEALGPVALTAACLPRCPPRLEGLIYDVSCAGGVCQALPEQHQCRLDVAFDGVCAGATASFDIGGRGGLSPTGACGPFPAAPDADLSVLCAAPSGASCTLSIYSGDPPPRVEIVDQIINAGSDYVALTVAAKAGLVYFLRPRAAPLGPKFIIVETEGLGFHGDADAPSCTDHLQAGRDGNSFYATSCSTVSPGRYDVGRYNEGAKPVGRAELGSGVSRVVGLTLAGESLLIAAERGEAERVVEVRDPDHLTLSRTVVIPGQGGALAAIAGLGEDRAVVLDAQRGQLVAFNPLDGSVEAPVPLGLAFTATVGVLVADDQTVTLGYGPFLQRFGGRPLVSLGPPRRPFAFQAQAITALSMIDHRVVLGAWGKQSATLASTLDGQLRLGAYSAQFGPLIGGAVDAEKRAWFAVPGGLRYLRARVVAP